MKRTIAWLIAGFILLGAAAIGALALTQEDRNINTAIVIDAPLSAVWTVLSDTRRYPEWNPFIRALTGDVRKGGRITVTLQIAPDETASYEANILGLIPDHEIRWEYDLPIPKMLWGKHKLIIDAEGAAATRLRHEEELRGLLVGPLIAGYLDRKRAAFEAMNRALKARVEGKR